MERFDHRIIIEAIEKGSKVLDLGCGSGELLRSLQKSKGINARGIEIKHDKIRDCVEKGLSVLHGDIDEGLKHFQDKSFDYAIFCETIQVVRNSLSALQEALRVGNKVIVAFPNFGHYKIRFSFFFSGRMPKSKSLPYEWYDTPNLRVLTTQDFRVLCRENGFRIIKEVNYIKRNGKSRQVRLWPNLIASNSVFVIEKDKKKEKSNLKN